MMKLNLFALLYLFAFEANTTTALANENDGSRTLSNDTFDGVPMKEWIMELHRRTKKNKKEASSSRRRMNGNRQLQGAQGARSSSSKEGRGDIRVLKEYYQNKKNGAPRQEENKMKPRTLSSNEEEEDLDVIIIGAGWSGISAAMTLKSKGITNFKILEARDTIGGRSRTINQTFANQTYAIDLGSMWVMNGKDNPLYDIMTSLGDIPIVKSWWYELLFKENNEGPFSDREFTKSYNDYLKFYDYQTQRQKSAVVDEALQVSADMFMNTLPSETRVKQLKRIIANYLELDYAAPMEELSLKYWDSDSYIGSGTWFFLPEGYSALIEGYAAPVSDKIMLNSVVTKIDTGLDGSVKVTYTDDSGSDSILKAKKVIVTVPLGVLKAKTIKFTPKLPPQTQRSIDGLGMGRTNKIFMFWNPDDVFWPSNIETLSDIVQANTDFTFYTSGQNYNGGRRPMLFAFYMGSEVEAMEDQLNYEKEVTARAMVVLRNMFGNDIKDPEKVYVTRWNQDEYSYGTYSFYKLGVGRYSRIKLGKPIRDDRVYFAGEATSFKYFATCHGAYLNGRSTGRKVARSLKKEKKT